jgi:hypothetical protein
MFTSQKRIWRLKLIGVKLNDWRFAVKFSELNGKWQSLVLPGLRQRQPQWEYIRKRVASDWSWQGHQVMPDRRANHLNPYSYRALSELPKSLSGFTLLVSQLSEF